MKGPRALSKGFSTRERIDRPPEEVWAYLTDFRNAKDWMKGIEDLAPLGKGPIEIGTRLSFKARGKEREARVTALEPGRQIALTSTQGGVTATYTYALAPDGDGTEVTLEAVCRATGAWRLLHPVIAMAMKQSDSSQLANLKSAMSG
jgi:uncharacterized protein YndB with AHSA1/START domain